MSREIQVRFCEHLEGRFLRMTRRMAGFEREADAKRFQEALRQRLEKFGLELHPQKTRLVEFGRFAASNRQRRGLGKPETFAFLGFVFVCGRSQWGAFQLHRKSRGDRMRAKLQDVKMQLRQRMHDPIPSKDDGCDLWFQGATSPTTPYLPTSRARGIPLPRDRSLAAHAPASQPKGRHGLGADDEHRSGQLPQPRVLHPWPNQRFDVKHPRWEPSA